MLLRLFLAGFLIFFPSGATWAQNAPATDWASDLLRRRARARDKFVTELSRALPKGWKVSKGSRGLAFVLPVSTAKRRQVAQLREVAIKARKWLEAGIGPLGKTKAGTQVLRVILDEADEDTYPHKRGLAYSFERREGVVAVRGRGDMRSVAQAVVSGYVDGRLTRLWDYVPDWIRRGLSAQAGSVMVTKRVGIIFKMPTRTWRSALKLLKERRVIPLVDLCEKSPEELAVGRVQGRANVRTFGELFVRYLTYGPGKKGRTRHLLGRYLDAIAREVEKFDQEAWAETMQKAESDGPLKETHRQQTWEEFEHALAKKRRIPRDARDDLRKRAYAAAFADWDPDDWKKLQRTFNNWIARGCPLK